MAHRKAIIPPNLAKANPLSQWGYPARYEPWRFLFQICRCQPERTDRAPQSGPSTHLDDSLLPSLMGMVVIFGVDDETAKFLLEALGITDFE